MSIKSVVFSKPESWANSAIAEADRLEAIASRCNRTWAQHARNLSQFIATLVARTCSRIDKSFRPNLLRATAHADELEVSALRHAISKADSFCTCP